MKALGYTEYSIDEVTYTNPDYIATNRYINTSLPTKVKHIIMYAKSKPTGSWKYTYGNVWKVAGDVGWKSQYNTNADENGALNYCFPASLNYVQWENFKLNSNFKFISLNSQSQNDGVIKVDGWYENDSSNPSVNKLYLLPTTYQIICFG
nr:MAG TPA_asm: hypothetical protein [Caudoviricetes sp.]